MLINSEFFKLNCSISQKISKDFYSHGWNAKDFDNYGNDLPQTEFSLQNFDMHFNKGIKYNSNNL